MLSSACAATWSAMTHPRHVSSAARCSAASAMSPEYSNISSSSVCVPILSTSIFPRVQFCFFIPQFPSCPRPMLCASVRLRRVLEGVGSSRSRGPSFAAKIQTLLPVRLSLFVACILGSRLERARYASVAQIRGTLGMQRLHSDQAQVPCPVPQQLQPLRQYHYHRDGTCRLVRYVLRSVLGIHPRPCWEAPIPWRQNRRSV